jgi:hypothetical protein
MAMEEPGARVVRRERDDHPSTARKHCNVPPGGILKLEKAEMLDAIEGSLPFAEDVKVVAV